MTISKNIPLCNLYTLSWSVFLRRIWTKNKPKDHNLFSNIVFFKIENEFFFNKKTEEYSWTIYMVRDDRLHSSAFPSRKRTEDRKHIRPGPVRAVEYRMHQLSVSREELYFLCPE